MTQKNAKDSRSSLQGTSEAPLKPLSRDELSRGDVSKKEMSSGGEFSAEHKEWLEAYDGEPGKTEYKPYRSNRTNRY